MHAWLDKDYRSSGVIVKINQLFLSSASSYKAGSIPKATGNIANKGSILHVNDITAISESITVKIKIMIYSLVQG